VWPLLLGAVRARTFPRKWHPFHVNAQPERTLINRDVLREAESDDRLIHPWLAGRPLRRFPPGTLWHVLSVAAAPMFYSSFEMGPHLERTMPLMSQPLIELCLRTPTYVLIKNGMDRATARRAFAPDLPAEIIKRRNKGRIDQHIRNIVDDNLQFIREMLLNGRLVKEGLLHRASLDLYLTRERSPADFQYSEILQEYLCIEAWLTRSLEDRAFATAPDSLSGSLTSSCAPGC
jgi:asparagine synthase (glutamine-hydrolysing)